MTFDTITLRFHALVFTSLFKLLRPQVGFILSLVIILTTGGSEEGKIFNLVCRQKRFRVQATMGDLSKTIPQWPLIDWEMRCDVICEEGRRRLFVAHGP